MSVCHQLAWNQLVCHQLARNQQSLEWYKIRDTLLGHNYVKQDINKAIDLAAVCKHPDAVWLTKVFLGRHVKDSTIARNILLEFKSDPRALCLVATIVHFHLDQTVDLRRAADLGDAYAQSIAGIRSGPGEGRLRWAQKSVAQGERNGFYLLGICYQFGDGCEEDMEKAKHNYQIAAELGNVLAMICFASSFDSTQRYVWFGKAAVCGYHSHFLYEMCLEINKFNSGFRRVNIIFAIGRVIKGHIDNKNQSLFGKTFIVFSDTMNAANQALQIYDFQLQSYRKAVDTWTIIGKRYNVVKDIRKMIGEIIWKSRDDAKYTIW